MTTRTFIDQCLAGEVSLDDIDDFIDRWHEGGSGTLLPAFLGMTREEYGLWVENQDVLPAIVNAHRSKVTVVESARALTGSAQGKDRAQMREIEAWLKQRMARPV